MSVRAGWVAALLTLPIALLALAAIWLPYMPNQAGLIGSDYQYWLPNLLAGTYWHAQNGLWRVPWFSPSQCGGLPLQPDPQAAYFSVAQFLSFVVPPVRAVQASFFVFAAAGFLGCFCLGRTAFALSKPAAVLAAVLFACNGFYAAHVVAGHLSFSPFMLLPAASACLIGPAHRGLSAANVVRAGCLAVLLGLMLEGGMLVLIPTVYLSLLMLLGLHAVTAGRSIIASVWRLAAGTALGLVLCAGKLATMLPLLGTLPRDNYPLPGFSNAAETMWVAFHALFLSPAGAVPGTLANDFLLLGPHEYDFSVGPVPVLLGVVAAIAAWRGGWRPNHAQRLGLEALLFLALVPIAVNTTAPGWTALLKHLPVIRNASSLLRWFAAYILPCAIVAGLALDRLTRRGVLRPWTICAFGITATLALAFFADRSVYGATGLGTYDPRRIEAAWHAEAASGRPPAIHDIFVARTPNGAVDFTSTARQDGVADGQSQLFCDFPLFGYWLENFPQGALHPGPVFDTTPVSSPGGSRLNLKNPACYVFPRENACKAGDAFAAADRKRAEQFVSYKAFAWNKPAWARLADWVGIFGWPLTVMAICVASLSTWRARNRSS